jgi:zinc protease
VPIPVRNDFAEPQQTSPKEEKMLDQHAQLPAFWIGWKIPPKRDVDYYPLLITEKILSAGESSRLFQRMVKGDQVAIKAEASMDERRGPGAFEAFIVYKPQNSADKVKNIFWSEMDKLKTTPVAEQELEKARNQILRNFFAGRSYTSLQTSLGRAELLAEYASFFGDPKSLDQDIDSLMKVTPADVQRVAQKYFGKDSYTLIDVEPGEKPKAAKS